MTDTPSGTPEDSGRHQSLGAILRTARERKGMELEDVAEVTHVRKEYLKALEEGRYQDLPEDVYARNFLRLFGQAVGLDPGPLLDRFTREKSAPPATRSTLVPGGREALRSPASSAPPARPSQPTRAEPDRSQPAQGSARRDRAPEPAWNEEGAQGPSFAGFDGGRRAAFPQVRIGSWVATVLLVAAIVAIALWAFNNQLFRTGRTAPPATTPTADAGGIAVPPDGAAPSAPEGTPAATEQARDVLLTVESEPPGAEVTVDGFGLPGTTPVRDVPVTARASRVLRLTLDGYQPFEGTYDLSFDRTISVILEPEVAAAPADEGANAVADGATPPATAGSGQIALNVTEATWLEVYSGTARGQGTRLVYTTAQPGDRYVFDLPVYVHVGNAAGLFVSVDGQDLGSFGSSGAVVGRAFTP